MPLTAQDEDMDYLVDQLEQEYGAITFQAFINVHIVTSCLVNQRSR